MALGTVNNGFSSTLGVQISLSRFNGIVIDEDSETVQIGAGLAWTDVYASIVPKGINVVGGRLNGVWVAGLTLGGENFTCLPHRYTAQNRNCTARQDLWFGLRGGLNNYVGSPCGQVLRD